MFELVHFSFKSSPILAQCPQLVQNMNKVSSKGSEAQTYGVQTANI